AGIVLLQVVRLIRPAENRERPQAGGEPGVEDIRILLDLGAAALLARRLLLLDAGPLVAARLTVPDRNAVAPPQLARDAPVLDVVHPVQVDAGEAFRDEAQLAGARDLGRRLGQRLHLDEPLGRDQRLDHRLAALAGVDGMGVRLLAAQQARLAEVRDHASAHLPRLLPGERPGVLVHRTVEVHHADTR